MTKQRSPRFPFVPLRAALTHLTKIHQAAPDGGRIKRLDAIKALGYDAPNGRVHRLVAALRGYGLMEIVDKGVFQVSPLGLRLIKDPQTKGKGKGKPNGPWLAAAREAVLNPPMFRRLWRNLRDLDREQLVAALMKRDFTEQGAEKAAEVFMRNRRIAGLDDMPEGLEPPVPRPAGAKDGVGKHGCQMKPGKGPGRPVRPSGPPRDAVVLPLGNQRAIVPTGISEADYKLLLETLTLWKDKIVKA